MSKLDQTKIPVKCPACKKNLDPTVLTIYSNRHIRCSCGSELEVGNSEANTLRQAVHKQESAALALQLAIRKEEEAAEEFKEAAAEAIDKAKPHVKTK